MHICRLQATLSTLMIRDEYVGRRRGILRYDSQRYRAIRRLRPCPVVLSYLRGLRLRR
jgi:hypothetical protein